MKSAAFVLLFLVGCSTPSASSCSPCGDGAGSIACPETVAACIADGAGKCETGGPGDLVLNADGTFAQEFGAYAQAGKWQEVDGVVILSVAVDYGPSVVGRLPVVSACR